jgi:hypothetical protein
MNTERRHELGTNTLAKGLNDWSDRLRPYTSAILAVIAAVLGVYIVASLWNSYQANRNRAAWDDYQLAMLEGDVEQKSLERLANSEDHAGTAMQEWALVGFADRQLLRASQLYLSDRKEALERLTSVAGIYDQFAASGSGPEIRNRARLGLARVAEMQGDLDEARQQYGRVEGALASVAAARIQHLETKPAEEAVKWLATTELPKRATPPGPGSPGERPGHEAALPPVDAAADSRTLEEIISGIGSEGAATPPATSPLAETPSTEATIPPVDKDKAPSGESAPAGEAATGAESADAPASEVKEPVAGDNEAQTPADGQAPSAAAEEASNSGDQ